MKEESTSRHSDKKYSRNGRIEESSGIASWRILQEWIERKSRYDTKAHFTETRVARDGEFFFEWFWRIFSRCRVDLQWKIISRSQSAGSRCKPSIFVEPRPSLQPDTWNLSEALGNVFGNPRPMFVSAQTLYQGILHSTNPSATGSIPVQVSAGRPVPRGEERIGSTTPISMSARRPSTMNSFLPAEVPQNSMAVKQRLQISELQFDKIPDTIIIFVLEDVIQNPCEFLFRFSIGSYVMDQRSGDGRFGGWIKIIAINKGYSFPEFWNAGRENCFCSEQDHPEFPLQKEGQSGGTESSERGSVPSRKTDRLHDLRLLSSHWCSWYSSWLCRFVLYHSSQRWCSGIWYEMGWNYIVSD